MKKHLFLWLIIAIILASLFQSVKVAGSKMAMVDYTTFVEQVNDHQIKEVSIAGQVISGYRTDGTAFSTVIPLPDRDLINQLINAKVRVNGTLPEQSSEILQAIGYWLPIIFFIAIWIFVARQMSGRSGGGGRFSNPFSIGQNKAKQFSAQDVKTTFADVAGCDEAKEEVREVIDFLKNSAKYRKLGGQIPKGILLVGPPGTGKTLLAKAIAGEAHRPFFFVSGSDFVEMFVGVGASRVREMFAEAKSKAPCIVFIDEIDAVGRRRSGASTGGNDEREQTLNQMLVEMDGFSDHETVVVIAATNRPDVLDSALLRPGRFDRQVTVGLPDFKGRFEILKVHTKKKPLSQGVDLMSIAKGTPGFSGADLANLANEAALCAARNNKDRIEQSDFEYAKDRIMLGTERKSMFISDKEKEMTAYHESGHAIVGKLVPDHDPVHKVSIIPHGRALGVTMYLPNEDRLSHSKEYLESEMSSLYAGRIAEEIIYGFDHVSTGASNDIERATQIARNMVTKWGMSKALPPQLYSDPDGEGRSTSGVDGFYSSETLKQIEDEVNALVTAAYSRAKKILLDNMDILHAMKDALMKYETIDELQIDDLMNRRPVREPSPSAENAGSGDGPEPSKKDEGSSSSDTAKDAGNGGSDAEPHDGSQGGSGKDSSSDGSDKNSK